MFDHTQNVYVMSKSYQIQWANKIQIPLIAKPHDG
jgi:hypothetical protein